MNREQEHSIKGEAQIIDELVEVVRTGDSSKLIEVLKPREAVFRFAESLSRKKLSSTQLRKIYDTTMKIGSTDKVSDQKESAKRNIDLELVKILTRIYYATKRPQHSGSGSKIPEGFKNFFEKCVKEIIDENDKERKQKKLEVFKEILRGIVAYHKYFDKS